MPVSPTDFLRLQKALAGGLITSLEDFYVVARSVMIKRERHFDLYDQLFANYFRGKELTRRSHRALDDELQELLQQWLQDPQFQQTLPDEEREKIKSMTPDELIKYFEERLKDQTERHDGGNRWIGTGGNQPGRPWRVPSGRHARWREGTQQKRPSRSPWTGATSSIPTTRRSPPNSSAKPCAHCVTWRRWGPKDELNIDKTIYETVRQGGEIELVFDRRLRDKLSVFLFIDNGGWSMTPFVERTPRPVHPRPRRLQGSAYLLFP